MTNTTTAKKSKEEKAFERKMARVSRALQQLVLEVGGIHHEANRMGYSEEQVDFVLESVMAISRASSKTRRAADRVQDVE